MRDVLQSGMHMNETHHAVVIENDEDVRDLVALILKQAGYIVHPCIDAVSGLDAVRSHDPEFVALDCTLRGADGYTVAEQIRRFLQVCITMLSARVDDTARVRAYSAGIDHYLIKPFSVRVLRETAQAVIHDPAAGTS